MRLHAGFEIGRPAAAVWDEMTGDSVLDWCRIIQGVRWTSPRPLGVGATREVKALWGADKLREHFFLWEEGRRHSFYVTESTGPLFKSLAEDYVIEPRGDDACRLEWTIAADPTAFGAAAMPVNRALLKTLFTDTARHFGVSS